MRVHRLEGETRIDRPREEVFAFFADARNLERITPRRLRFREKKPREILEERGRRDG